MQTRAVLFLTALVFALPSVASAQLVRSGAGANPAAILDVVNQFRNDLGPLNPNNPGSLPTGRREISWDGVPDALAAPNFLPFDFFNQNTPGSARGVNLITPGLGVQVSADSANPTNTDVRFAHINPTYKDIFQTFSPERLFSPIGSNLVDLSFFVPGSTIPATVRGFGAVYTDTDIAGASSFEYFDFAGNSLGQFAIPAFDGGLSFLGVSFADAIVGRVRIVYGTVALGPNDGGGVDVAVMDDFIFGEPQPVPEPGALGLLASGVVLGAGVWLGSARRRRE